MSKRQKILIVDDREENLFVLEKILRDTECETIQATSGNEALAATLHHDFSLAIVDVEMPEMSGFELVEHLRSDEKMRSLPIIFLTAAFGEEESIAKGYEVGGIDYIVKPFSPAILKSKVAIFLEISAHRKHLNALVQERTHDLEERVKELNCLYRISELTDKQDMSLEEILQGIVDLIPPAWQYPEITCARIVLGDQEFKTENFGEAVSKQTGDIIDSGERIGTLEVGYLEKRPEADEGPFLREERSLIITIAERMGKIIEHVRAEEALRRWEQIFRHAEWGVAVSSPDGKSLELVNPAYAKMHGYTVEELTGKPVVEQYAPESRAELREQIRMIQERGHQSFESMHIRKDGAIFPVLVDATAVKDERGEFQYRIVNVQDISERKKAEEAVRQSEQRFRTLFEDSKDGVYSTTRDGMLVMANPSFVDILGYTGEELMTLNVKDLYADPADRARFQREIEKEGSVRDYEVSFRRKDGKEIECLLTSTVRTEEDGTIVGYQGILRDVTQSRLLEKQLRQAQKMEAIGTLSGGIAHDFNNLLTIILGYAELSLLEKSEGEPGYEDLHTILQTTKRGADLVRQMLTFSREVETKPRPISLNHEVEHVQKLLYKTIPKMINIELLPDENLKTINADPVQVEQVLMNLALNAKDAMPDGGRLVLETANVFLDEEYCKTHLEAEPGEYVLLTVSDTGHGIEREALEHIFEPFYSTKKPGEGTGLGLSMVHGIVKQNGGYIMCYSEPGEGTTFKIYLPITEFGVEPDTATIGEMPAFGTETILLVDDEELISGLGERILSGAGYTVLAAGNGQEALEVYRKQQADISLVILDLIMPEMGGRECLEELLKIDPDAKVLIASGFSVNGPTKGAIESGAGGFLGKPFETGQLLQTVRKVLDET